jgi:hypothetical protein
MTPGANIRRKAEAADTRELYIEDQDIGCEQVKAPEAFLAAAG